MQEKRGWIGKKLLRLDVTQTRKQKDNAQEKIMEQQMGKQKEARQEGSSGNSLMEEGRGQDVKG